MAVYVPNDPMRHTTNADLKNRMGYHKATSVTVPLHEVLRAEFIQLATELNETLPEGREKSLAFTALQEALMWANAAVAINLAPLEVE